MCVRLQSRKQLLTAQHLKQIVHILHKHSEEVIPTSRICLFSPPLLQQQSRRYSFRGSPTPNQIEETVAYWCEYCINREAIIALPASAISPRIVRKGGKWDICPLSAVLSYQGYWRKGLPKIFWRNTNPSKYDNLLDVCPLPSDSLNFIQWNCPDTFVCFCKYIFLLLTCWWLTL